MNGRCGTIKTFVSIRLNGAPEGCSDAEAAEHSSRSRGGMNGGCGTIIGGHGMMKRIRRGGALAVSLMFLMLAALPKVAYGADVIDLSADCSIEFHLENLVAVKGEAGDTEFSDLRDGSGVTVSVNLYKVADVTAGGRYEVTEAYRTEDEEKAEILQSELDKVSMHTTQADWETMAGYAETLAGVDLENEVFPQTDLQVQTDENGIGRIDQDDGLSSGLYLAAAEPAESAEYKYYFQSYLIALPDNQYYKTGSEEWDYHPEVGLKAAWEQRYGKLVIKKQLRSFNQTLGGATFVYQVTAKRPDGTVAYNDIVSLQFDGQGEKSSMVIADRIPAGSKVTVTEVYTGASYVADGPAEWSIESIPADIETAASFANRYDGESLKGGTSVENHFIYQEPKGAETVQSGGSETLPAERSRSGGTWDWKQKKDSSVAGAEGE